MAKPSPNPDNNTTTTDEDNDYSPSATLIHFDHPLPLLRGPTPTSPPDDPALGPYVLAFPSPKAFGSSLRSTESKLLEQCEAGVRIGCSIAASNSCRPPWWKTLFGGSTITDYKERSECEEREMRACLEGSREKCEAFAKEKCVGPFGRARVRVGVRERRLMREKEVVGRLIGAVSGMGFGNGNGNGDGDVGLKLGMGLLLGGELREVCEMKLGCDVGYVRGSEILGERLA